jgi:hypothetical protein
MGNDFGGNVIKLSVSHFIQKENIPKLLSSLRVQTHQILL